MVNRCVSIPCCQLVQRHGLTYFLLAGSGCIYICCRKWSWSTGRRPTVRYDTSASNMSSASVALLCDLYHGCCTWYTGDAAARYAALERFRKVMTGHFIYCRSAGTDLPVCTFATGTAGLYSGVFLVGCSFGSMFTLNVVISSELWGLRHHGESLNLFVLRLGTIR